jgi:hypothetical protein
LLGQHPRGIEEVAVKALMADDPADEFLDRGQHSGLPPNVGERRIMSAVASQVRKPAVQPHVPDLVILDSRARHCDFIVVENG